MASKGKLKRHEMDFGNKRIDVRRYAYDVIKYSALKFGVPENCIDAWKGSDNDYGCPDFCMALFRVVIENQIILRYDIHAIFTQHYESNKLESYKLIRSLFQDVISKYIRNHKYKIADEEISLSIACELVLFLHSKKLNLYVQELARDWFDCHLRFVKKPFEKAGGLKAMYLKRCEPERCMYDAFYNKFVSVYCLPYEDSAKHQNLKESFKTLYDNYGKILEYFLQKQCKETDDIFVCESSGDGGITEYEIVMLPVTSKRNEASGNDIPENSDIEMTTFNILMKFFKTDEYALLIAKAVSKVFNEASSQDQPQHSTVTSAQNK